MPIFSPSYSTAVAQIYRGLDEVTLASLPRLQSPPYYHTEKRSKAMGDNLQHTFFYTVIRHIDQGQI